MVRPKYELEAALREERRLIAAGRLKEDSPLDTSRQFQQFCEACRKGDVQACEEHISLGVNINARDRYDYTPLILASLCGHYGVVKYLLEAGALCERDTFQGERCFYNALNDEIRNLLLSYNYSKATGPLQPLALYISSLLKNPELQTSDITFRSSNASINLHKFILSARSPYIAKKLRVAPNTSASNLPSSIPFESVELAIKHLYLGEVSLNLNYSDREEAILVGIDKISKHLGVDDLLDTLLDASDLRIARQRRTHELIRARDQLAGWFESNVIQQKLVSSRNHASTIRWPRDNAVFADVILRADEDHDHHTLTSHVQALQKPESPRIPVGGFFPESNNPSTFDDDSRAVFFPVHRAMLARSRYFQGMFSSGLREAQDTPNLQVVPVDCTPAVLEAVLRYLYTEGTEFPISIALDVLYTADLLLLDRLKQRAATIISTMGSDLSRNVITANGDVQNDGEQDELHIFDVIRAGWNTRVPKLEAFGAQYIAERLDRYIDDPEFATLVSESASRIQDRQEVDSVELIDDIRHYLAEQYRRECLAQGRPSGPETMPGSWIDDQPLYNTTKQDNDTSDERNNQMTREERYQLLLDKIEDLLDQLSLAA